MRPAASRTSTPGLRRLGVLSMGWLREGREVENRLGAGVAIG